MKITVNRVDLGDDIVDLLNYLMRNIEESCVDANLLIRVPWCHIWSAHDGIPVHCVRWSFYPFTRSNLWNLIYVMVNSSTWQFLHLHHPYSARARPRSLDRALQLFDIRRGTHLCYCLPLFFLSSDALLRNYIAQTSTWVAKYLDFSKLTWSLACLRFSKIDRRFSQCVL